MKRSLQKHFVENPPEILKKVRECWPCKRS
jgi:hypothetical protein